MENIEYLKLLLFIVIYLSKYTYSDSLFQPPLQKRYDEVKLNLIRSYEEHFNNNHDHTTESDNALIRCISELNVVLKQRTELLNHLKHQSKYILRNDKNMVYPGELVVNNKAILKNATIKNMYSTNTYTEDVKPTVDQIKNLENQVNENCNFCNVIIMGNLYIENLNSTKINVHKINDYPWSPNRWLSTVNNQVVTAPVMFKQLKIKDLIDENPNSIFTDFLYVDQKIQNIRGTYVLNSLKTNSLMVENINNIILSNIKLKSNAQIVQGNKYFKTVKTYKISSTLMHKNKNFKYLSQNYPTNIWLDSGTYIEHLKFDIINGISWQNFTECLFRRLSDQAIIGTLNIFSPLHARHITVEILAGIDAGLFMTTSTNQTISSDMQLMHINVKDIEAQRVNGISFKKDVVTINTNNVIEGHIHIKHVFVQNNLTTTDKSFKLLKNPKIATLQMYDGIVKINGSLQVNNVYLKSGLNYDNELSESRIISQYWSKKNDQVIPVNITTFDIVNSNKLMTESVNSISLDSFTKVNVENEQLQFMFENVVVQGNFRSAMSQDCKFNLEKLDAESVKKQGSFKIRGHKVYQNGLTINKLDAAILDNTVMDRLVKLNGPNHFIAPQTFSHIIFKEDIHLLDSKNIKGKKINTHNLSPLIQRTIFVHDTINISHLFVNRITGTNVNFRNSNGLNVDDVTNQVMQLYFMSKINHLFVIGNMHINSMDLVQKVNNIDIEDYLRKVAFKNKNIRVSNQVNFTSNCFIENAYVQTINNVDLIDLNDKYLSKKKQQTITELYVFDSVYSPFISTPKLNNIYVDNLINTASSNDIKIFSDLYLMSLNVSKSIQATYLNNEINEITSVLQNPTNQFWQSITVMKNVEVNNNGGNLGNIIYNMVKSSDSEILIHEDMNFKYVSAGLIQLNKFKINNINIRNMYDDALKSNDEVKVVTGHNTFRKIRTARLAVKKNANIKTVNKVNIQQFNNTFIDRAVVFSSIIRGQTVFNNLKIDKLQVPEKVHSILPENLFSTKRGNLSLPNIHIANVKTINLNVGFVSSYNISQMLQERMVLNGATPQFVTKFMQFDSVTLLDKSRISTINEISVNDVVLDEGIQQINVPKRFSAPVEIFNHLNVNQINGYKPEEVYANALFIEKDVSINNVIFQKPVNLTKNINMIQLNNINKTFMLNLVNNNNFKLKNEKTFDVIEEIEKKFVAYLSEVSEKHTLPPKLQLITEHIPLKNFGNWETSKLLNIYRTQSSTQCSVDNLTDTSNRLTNNYKNPDLYLCVNHYRNNGEQNYINYNFSLNSNNNNES